MLTSKSVASKIMSKKDWKKVVKTHYPDASFSNLKTKYAGTNAYKSTDKLELVGSFDNRKGHTGVQMGRIALATFEN